MADTPDPSEALSGLTPEVKQGPLGVPILAPEAAPDPPGGGGAGAGVSDYLPDGS